MNDINHERGILRRRLKDDLVNHFRSHANDNRLTLASLVIKGLACRLLAFRQEISPEQVAEQHYGKSAVQAN